MRLLLVPLAFILLVVGLTYALFLLENLRSGHLARMRRQPGGALRPLLRGVSAALAEQILLVGSYPLGWLPPRERRAGGPVVLLVHGLYHNRAAWILFRRRLARAGYANARFFSYSSFTRDFDGLRRELSERILDLAAEGDAPVALIGHSLGGLLLRAAVCDERLRGRAACLLTLGSPHRGSTLAHLALGGLGRSLRPGTPLMRGLAVLREPADLPRLALVSPVDNMVLPAENLLPPPGWEVREVAPMSHVAMLYHPEPAELAVDFLKRSLPTVR
ncbi:alpha/beta fold hydrolase [Desulfovibrio sp.]